LTVKSADIAFMLITLTTDFGLQDAFVGVMKGVIAGINAQAHVIDLTHDIPAQNILAGALTLRHSVAYFPTGTIHVAVVDPGVGSARLPLLIECGGSYFIGPDNGVLSLAIGGREPSAIRSLANPAYHLQPASATFHGRDIFAPAAAHLSRGVPPSEFGEKLPTFRRLTLPLAAHGPREIIGEIIYIDHFGNLFTNIEERDLKGLADTRHDIIIGAGVRVSRIAPNYASADPGDLIAVINSWGLLEIAAPGGSAQQRAGANIGEQVKIAIGI
jgi:S-adenosylmethionine hydrolase